MQELECVREKLQNKYRVVKTDEDLEWNRAIDLCTNIINAHLSRENDPEIARSSRDNDGWIPVDDRLPEEHEEGTDIYDKNTLAVMDTEYHMVSNLVNVTVYDYENEKYFVGADCTFDGEWCNFGLVTGNYEVIAWRPLPETYRPERSEE